MDDTAKRTEELLVQSGALRHGHFLLSSGLHSDRYCQCASLFEAPHHAAEIASLMASQLIAGEIDTVLAPALGGILWGYELARALDKRSLFAERDTQGNFALRRGFALAPGERVLLAEDVLTTGKSVMELRPLAESHGARIVGIAAILDRSRGQFTPPGIPVKALVRLDFQTYRQEDCPMCEEGLPVEKPGSRKLV